MYVRVEGNHYALHAAIGRQSRSSALQQQQQSTFFLALSPRSAAILAKYAPNSAEFNG